MHEPMEDISHSDYHENTGPMNSIGSDPYTLKYSWQAKSNIVGVWGVFCLFGFVLFFYLFFSMKKLLPLNWDLDWLTRSLSHL